MPGVKERKVKIMRKIFKKVVALTAMAAIACTSLCMPNAAKAANDPTDSAIADGKEEFNPDGEYYAYFQFQADKVWIFRDPYYKKDTGAEGENFDKMKQSKGNEVSDVEGTVTDAVIKGNGTYTVSVKGLNGIIPNDGSAVVKMIGVTTDIPNNDAVKFTNVKTKIDGVTKLTQDEAIIDDEALDAPGTLCIAVNNLYRNDETLSTDFQIPSDSVEVTFTVSGFSKDDPDATEATPKPVKTESNDDSTSDDSSSTNMVVPIAAVVAVVVVVGVVVVVVRKKKK